MQVLDIQGLQIAESFFLLRECGKLLHLVA